MARIHPIGDEEASPEAQAAFAEQKAAHGRVTNMKRTLAHSPVAFEVMMQFYPIFEEVKSFLGERAALLFTHAISSQTDCLICSTYFRRLLIDAGENPDELQLDPRDQLIVDYGRQLARDAHAVDDDLFARLQEDFDPSRIVALTALGAMMIATNLINNALKVELDDYLVPYLEPRASKP